MNDERSKEFENTQDRAGKRELSLLEAFDLVLASIPRTIEIVASCSSCDRKLPPRKRRSAKRNR